MKVKEKEQARFLRKQGFSINQISTRLMVAKSSVSVWVRDINLSSEQLHNLAVRGQTREVVERRRQTRITRESTRRQIIIDRARSDISRLSKRDLFILGIALYWGEGSKTNRGSVQMVNTDPRLIKISMKFFRDICNVAEERFRGHVHLHPHLDVKQAEEYWSLHSGIPLQQFFKTSMQQSRSSKHKRDSLPYGTFSIYVCDTELFLKIKGWTEGIANLSER